MNADVRPYSMYVLPPYVLSGTIMGTDGLTRPHAADIDHPASAFISDDGKIVTKRSIGRVIGVAIYNS